MNILLLRGFNNYFNRIVKKYSTLADYKSNSQSYLEFNNINFNPNDGIVTELILGSQYQQESGAPLAWDILGTPDYLICYENEGDPAVAVIKFRWFVLESERTRDGQYRLALKRDVVAEHFDNIMAAPCFVEKGNIRDLNNPLLVNPEGNVVNQIKKSETPVVDETNSAWLVGYIKKNDAGATQTASMTADLENVYDYNELIFKDCIEFQDQAATKTLIGDLGSSCFNLFYTIRGKQWPVDHYYDYRARMIWNSWLGIDYQGSQGNPNYGQLTTHLIYANNNDSGPTTNWASWMESATGDNSIPASIRNNFFNYIKSSLKSNNNLYEAKDLQSGTSSTDIRSKYNNAIILKDGKYYRLNFSNGASSQIGGYYNSGSSATIGSYFAYVVNALNTNANGKTTFSYNSATTGTSLQGSLFYTQIQVTAYEIANIEGSITATLPQASSRINCDDALYDIFAVPYVPKQYRESYISKFKYNNANIEVNSDACLFIIQKLMTYMGIGGTNGRVYDLQLLPYCPIQAPLTQDGSVALDELDTKSFSIITQRRKNQNNVEYDQPIGYMLFPSSANFTKNISIEKKLVESHTSQEYKRWTSLTADEVSEGVYSIESKPSELALFGYSPTISLPKGNITSYTLDPVTGISINGYSVPGAIFTLGEKIPNPTLIPTPNEIYKFSVTNIVSSHLPDPNNVTLSIRLKVTIEENLSPIDLKISNECDFLRLTAPNFNSSYEFKLSKLQDSRINSINADCTYRPINPYIKMNPDFSYLYGQDWNDSTGLLFNGDFSLSTLTDQWVNYELNNKNYQAIFNRQIQSMDAIQALERDQMSFQNLVGAITGPITGAAGGALAGGKLGGGYGAAAGAAAGFIGGTVLGIAGGIKNNEWLARQQGEAKSYAIDMYNYQLGNIKALPQSLTKGDPITYNNKVWPIIEEFSCTDVEKQVLRDKIKYNGMTIMAIGSLNDYSKSNEFDNVYVKGQLIRLTDVHDDFHVIDAIYQEVDKGFYIPQ